MNAPRIPTALIADDEPLLRQRLEQLLNALWPELQIIARARNGREAMSEIERSAPTVAFLDIQMPVLTGLEVAQQCSTNTHVVFVTAFEQHAIKAFETGAVDYILKPIDEERLALTLNRVKERITEPAVDMRDLLQHLAQGASASRNHLQWIRASVGKHIRLIQTTEILFFQSDEKYTKVVTASGEHVIRKSIRELLDELDPDQFTQIHRNTIVNLHAIDHVIRQPVDFWEIQVKGHPHLLRISRTYLNQFKQM